MGRLLFFKFCKIFTSKSNLINSFSNIAFKFLLILLLIGFFGCSKSGHKKVKLVPQKDFINLLVDIHLADGILLQDFSYGNPVLNIDSAKFYDGIFRKYNVKKINFDSTMRYYSQNPKDFDLVYDQVIRKLSKIEGELINQQKKIELKTRKKNIWNTLRDWRFPKDGKNLCLSFSIPIKELGTYRLSSKIKVYTDDKSTNTRMMAWYWYKDSTKFGHFDYFQPRNIVKNGGELTYVIAKELKDPKVTYLKGFILYSDNLKAKVLRHIEVHELEVTNTPSPKVNP